MCKSTLLLLLTLFASQLPEVHSGPFFTKCDNFNKQFDRYPFYPYNCPTGTKWRQEVGCCVGCVECNVGYKRSPECKGPCLPCPENFYNDKINSYECLSCPRCEDLHRVQTHKCSPTWPTRCGACIKGYFVQPGAPTTLPCIKCVPGIEDPACPQITTTTTTTTMKITTSTEALTKSTETQYPTRVCRNVKEEQNYAGTQWSVILPTFIITAAVSVTICAALFYCFKSRLISGTLIHD